MSKSGNKKPTAAYSSTAVPPSQRTTRWRLAGLCLVLAAITFGVFSQTLHHEFVDYDDQEYVYDNPVVSQGLTLKGLAWAFNGPHAANWHPLTWLSHMLDCQIYGLKPGGHHLSNVLLHTATVILLFLVLRHMTGSLWRSFFVAAVFAIHPLRVESVAWVAERKDVLSGLFFVLTIGAYARYARKPWSWWNYGLVLLMFALGLLSKPMLVTLPLILLLLDYWPLQRKESIKRLALEKLPLLALSAASCFVTLLAQTKAMHSFSVLSLPLRLANALVSCLIYLGQMIWPAHLAAFYSYPRNGLPIWEVALAALLLLGISTVAFWQRRRQPWMSVGWVWYLVMLAPVIGIFQVGSQAHADRYTYLPQIGIYVAMIWLLAQWCAKLRLKPVGIGCAMAGVVAALMVCAWNQTVYWKNAETLWLHALDCDPRNEMANFNLSTILWKRGQADAAIDHLQVVVETSPGFADGYANLGTALLQKGKLNDAIGYFQKALELNSNAADARYGLGSAFSRQGKVAEAINQYQLSLQIKSDNPEVLNNLASLLATCPDASLRNAAKAVELARQANDLTGGSNPIILQTLAIAFSETGRFNDSVKCAQKAIEVARASAQHDLEERLKNSLKRCLAGLPYQE